MTITSTPHRTTDQDEGPARVPSIEARIADFADRDHRRVVAAVALWSGSIDDAVDAVADALGRAWEKLDKGEPIDNFAAFVTTVAMNQVRSQHRRRSLARRHRQLLRVIEASDPTDALVTRLSVARALDSLTRRQREIVALRYGADLAVSAIAERLSIAEGTVKATLHQARAALAGRLGPPVESSLEPPAKGEPRG